MECFFPEHSPSNDFCSYGWGCVSRTFISMDGSWMMMPLWAAAASNTRHSWHGIRVSTTSVLLVGMLRHFSHYIFYRLCRHCWVTRDQVVHLKIDDYIRFSHDDRPLSSDVPDALKQHLALQLKSQEENKKQRWERTKTTKENRWEQMRTQDAKKWRFAVSPFRGFFSRRCWKSVANLVAVPHCPAWRPRHGRHAEGPSMTHPRRDTKWNNVESGRIRGAFWAF